VIRAALDALDAAGVPFATRGEQPIDDPPPGGDVDILVAVADADAAERVLESAGFRRLVSPGHRLHRFYLAFAPATGNWLKIDVSLVPRRLGWDLRARDERSLRRFAGYRVGMKARRGTVERIWSALARRRPLGLRRQGPVIAVLGPDGAGKGSVIAALRARIPATVTPLYLGHGDASRAEYGASRRSAPRAEVGRVRAAIRRVLALLPYRHRDAQYRVRRGLRLALRALVAYVYAWRGDVVLCDRHPLELLAVDGERDTLGGALERRVVSRLVPWPDAVVLLDAPGEVLYARKGEHSPALLERWRQTYRDVFGSRNATIVSTTAGLEPAVREASGVLWAALSRRRSW
jgi:thymidylate kinase